MNICIEAHPLNTKQRAGLVTYTEGLINGLERNDKENNYSLAYYSLRRTPEQMPGTLNDSFKKHVIRVPDGRYPGRKFLIDDVFLPGFLRKKNIDVFHRLVGYRMPSCKGVYKVITVHDLRTLAIGDNYKKQNVANYKKALDTADKIVVVSKCTKDDVVRYFNINEKKIIVTHLAASDMFRPVENSCIEEVRRKHKINGPFLLAISPVPRKNAQRIIQSFAKCKFKDDFVLALVCKHDIEKHESLAQELGVRSRIVFLKEVNDPDIVALYCGCHCFVFPSLYEGFGLPIIEAMQCGVPVITSNVSSCPEVAGDAAILVNPKSVEEITDAMDQICSDNSLRESLVVKGYDRAKMFSWDKFALVMKDVYLMR